LSDRQTIETLLATDEIDALVVIYIPADVSQKPMILEAIAASIAPDVRLEGPTQRCWHA
jgi:hypothetical protein